MDDNLIGFLGLILAVGIIFECILLGIAFFGADKVECNLLWCTFTTERSSMNDSIIIETHQTCFLNGYQIDCDDNRTSLPKIITDGNFDSEPIFKYDNEWKDILE